VFVSNVVSGTVTRLDLAIMNGKPVVMGTTHIAKGYMVQPNAAAVILGPTGLAYDDDKDVLYVASTADNKIFVVPNAGLRTGPPANGTGAVFIQDSHLRGPLGLVLAPNGDLITANGDAVNGDTGQPSEIVEFNREGRFVRQFNVNPAQGGAFGIAVERSGEDRARLAVVDDNTNDIIVFKLRRSDD
jgi:sugar lactone lactonase YvrE